MLDLSSIPIALRAARDPGLAQIEDAALTASQPREQAFYDGWLLRYANGKAKRARSVNLTGPGERPLDEKLTHCAAFYARHGLPFLLRVTPFSQPRGVDALLEEAGFTAAEDTRVMVLPLAEAVDVPGPGVALESLGGAEFGATLASLHGLDPQRAAVEQDRYARGAGDRLFLALRRGDGVVACGSATIDGHLAGIFGMVTAPDCRNRGFATAIVAELLQRVRARGCTTAYLQVEAGNAPARKAYSKFGFRDGYAYWYRYPRAAEERTPC